MTATVAPYAATKQPNESRPAPPAQLPRDGARWWAGAPTTPLERADLPGVPW